MSKTETSILERQALRLLHEFRRVSTARIELGMNTDLINTVKESVMLVELRRVLMLAIERSNELTREGVTDILERFKEEDEKAMTEVQAKQVAKTVGGFSFANFIDGLNQQSQPCATCGQHLCVGCGKCHDCETRKEAPVN